MKSNKEEPDMSNLLNKIEAAIAEDVLVPGVYSIEEIEQELIEYGFDLDKLNDEIEQFLQEIGLLKGRI